MKKIMKLRRILAKINKHNKECRSKKKNSRKISFKKKYLFQQIESPLNTNEFLINNGSSPFLAYDDEDSINIKPSSIIRLEDDTNPEINIFDLKDNESTNEESMILNEKFDSEKEQMEKCLDKENK